MIIDMEKQRAGRSNAHRTFIIGAAYRSARDGKWSQWFNTQDYYAIVSASSRIEALRAYLKSRPDLVEHAKKWSFDLDPEKTMAGQRVWTVRYVDDDHLVFPNHDAGNFGRDADPLKGTNYLLLF